jgi:hypothetical protein
VQHSSIACHGHPSLSLSPSSATTSPLNRGSRQHRALQSTSATRNILTVKILHLARASNDASYSVRSGITSTVNRKETHPVPNVHNQTTQEHTDRESGQICQCNASAYLCCTNAPQLPSPLPLPIKGSKMRFNTNNAASTMHSTGCHVRDASSTMTLEHIPHSTGFSTNKKKTQHWNLSRCIAICASSLKSRLTSCEKRRYRRLSLPSGKFGIEHAGRRYMFSVTTMIRGEEDGAGGLRGAYWEKEVLIGSPAHSA